MSTLHPSADTARPLKDHELEIDEIVRRCRAVATATGFAWLHDLVREELERLDQKFAA